MTTLTSNFLVTGYANRCASVAAAAADAAYPVSNLLGGYLSSRARSPSGTTSGWTIDLLLQNAAHTGAPTDVEAVSLLGVGLVSDSLQARFQLTTGLGATGTVLGDSGTIAAWDTSYGLPVDPSPPWGRVVSWLPPATVSGASYLRVTLSDPANSSGQIEVAEVKAGPVLQPALVNGVASSIKDDWRMEDKVLGNPGVEVVLRVHRLTFPVLTEAEAARMLTLARWLRSTGRVVVVPRPAVPAAGLVEVAYSVVSGYSWSVVPKAPDRRAVQITFQEVND